MRVIDYINLAQGSVDHLLSLPESRIDEFLRYLAKKIVKNGQEIIRQNQKDLLRMDSKNPKFDRLLLTPERIFDLSESLIQVSKLKNPTLKTIEKKELPSGLKLEKKSFPLGVVGAIFESRPNVIVDIFGLCFKTRNTCVLKGGSDAEFTNIAIKNIIQEALKEFQIPIFIIYLLPAGRKYVKTILEAKGDIDVIIPRGSQGLIDFVVKNSVVPVIETGAGVCHCFVDSSANLEYAKNIVYNAKTRRPSVCNSLDTLVIEYSIRKHLPEICRNLKNKSVKIYCDDLAYKNLKGKYPENLLFNIEENQDDYFGKEFLDYKLSIKVVDSFRKGIEFIKANTSKHSETLISENKQNQANFINFIDAAVVYINTSIAFTDGGEFGMGCEVGISTQKLHARGPMGLQELMTYKWIGVSDGLVR